MLQLLVDSASKARSVPLFLLRRKMVEKGLEEGVEHTVPRLRGHLLYDQMIDFSVIKSHKQSYFLKVSLTKFEDILYL